MAIVLESFKSAITTAAGTSVIVDKPAGTAANDMLIFLVGSSGLNVSGIVWPAGVTERNDKSDTIIYSGIATKKAGSSEPASYTIDFTNATSGRGRCGLILRITGYEEVEADVINISNGTVRSVESEGGASFCPDITTDGAPCLILRYLAVRSGNGGGNVTNPGGANPAATEILDEQVDSVMQALYTEDAVLTPAGATSSFQLNHHATVATRRVAEWTVAILQGTGGTGIINVDRVVPLGWSVNLFFDRVVELGWSLNTAIDKVIQLAWSGCRILVGKPLGEMTLGENPLGGGTATICPIFINRIVALGWSTRLEIDRKIPVSWDFLRLKVDRVFALGWSLAVAVDRILPASWSFTTAWTKEAASQADAFTADAASETDAWVKDSDSESDLWS